MAALWAFLLEVVALCSPPFAVCWICWVEVRGSQCHVSEIISWLHSLSLLVCLEISLVAWFGSQDSTTVGVKAQGAVTQNCIFCEITCATACSLWRRRALQGVITGTEKNINSYFLPHQQTLQPEGKLSKTTSAALTFLCCSFSSYPRLFANFLFFFKFWELWVFIIAQVKTCQLPQLWEKKMSAFAIVQT